MKMIHMAWNIYFKTTSKNKYCYTNLIIANQVLMINYKGIYRKLQFKNVPLVSHYKFITHHYIKIQIMIISIFSIVWDKYFYRQTSYFLFVLWVDKLFNILHLFKCSILYSSTLYKTFYHRLPVLQRINFCEQTSV